ncbi:hypothetical protein ABK040_008590 [Willaertia magna]
MNNNNNQLFGEENRSGNNLLHVASSPTNSTTNSSTLLSTSPVSVTSLHGDNHHYHLSPPTPTNTTIFNNNVNNTNNKPVQVDHTTTVNNTKQVSISTTVTTANTTTTINKEINKKDFKKEEYLKRKKIKQQHKRKLRKIISFFKNLFNILNNQSSWFILSILFIFIALVITLPLAFFEGVRRTNINDQNIAYSILMPLRNLINRNKAWVNYFATTPSFGETFCNYTKLQHCRSNGLLDCNVKYPYNLQDASLTINMYTQFARYYNSSVFSIRVIGHDGREMIRIDNKENGKGYIEPVRATKLQSKAGLPFYNDYFAGRSVNDSYSPIIELYRENVTSGVFLPFTPVTRVQRTMLCDLNTDSNELDYLFKGKLDDSKLVRGNDGKLMMRAGFVIIVLKMTSVLNSAHEVADQHDIMLINDRGQYLFNNQNSSKEFLQDIYSNSLNDNYNNNTNNNYNSLFTKEDYDNTTLNYILQNIKKNNNNPLTTISASSSRKTLFYSSFNTGSENLIAISTRDMQYIFYNGFYLIVVGLFGIFFIVTMFTLFALVQTLNIENLLITKYNLTTALQNQMKLSTDIRDNYEKIYYSLIPDEMLEKLIQFQKGNDGNAIIDNDLNNNYYEKEQLFEMKKNTVAVSLHIDFKPSRIYENGERLTSDKFIKYFAEVNDLLKKIATFHGFHSVNVNSRKMLFIKTMPNDEDEDSEIHSESSSSNNLKQQKQKSSARRNSTSSSSSLHGSAYDYLLSSIQFIISVNYIFNGKNYYINECDKELNLPKVITSMHVGNCYVGISPKQIPCLNAYGELIDRLCDMSNQCKDWKNIYISECVYTKLQIASSILSDYCKLSIQRGINPTSSQLKLKSLELLGLNSGVNNNSHNSSNSSISTPTTSYVSQFGSQSSLNNGVNNIISGMNEGKGIIPKTSLSNHKDFILYTMTPSLLSDEAGGLGEIRKNDHELFNAFFVPKDVEDKLILE